MDKKQGKKKGSKGKRNRKHGRCTRSPSHKNYLAQQRAKTNAERKQKRHEAQVAWKAKNKVLHGSANPLYKPAPKPAQPDPTPAWVRDYYALTTRGQESTKQWLIGAHRKALTAQQRIEETHTQPLTRAEYIAAGLIKPASLSK